MTIRVYIGIGSNLDNPVAQVLEAVEELEMIPDTILAERSTLYSARPHGARGPARLCKRGCCHGYPVVCR